MAPNIYPGALFLRSGGLWRVQERQERQEVPPGGPRGAKNESWRSSASKTFSRKGLTPAWRRLGASSSLAQAPRGGTIIKENRLNNDSKQDLTRRWAAKLMSLLS